MARKKGKGSRPAVARTSTPGIGLNVLGRTRRLLERAREMPFAGCWVRKDWRQEGMTSVLVARQQDRDRVLYGVYLVDLQCVGVKDAFVRTDVSPRALRRHLKRLGDEEEGRMEPCSVPFAHQLIYGAIEYARRYGLEPSPEFTRTGADRILDPPGTHPEVAQIPFGGPDGQPLFMPGPYDSELWIRQVLTALRRTAGKGNFTFVLSLTGLSDSFDPFDE